MKFLHTADWQIGMRAAHVGPAGARVREERLTAARRVMTVAREHAVDFVVLAGDTFEDHGVDRVLVQAVADVLATSPVPVYILPGNHDPLVPGAVWDHAAWTAHPRAVILRGAQALAVPGGVLVPAPLRSRHGDRDPTAQLDARGHEGRVKLGVAHGTVLGPGGEAPEFPIARDAARRAGLDFLALGHFHSTALYPTPEGPVTMAYPGTHESTRFGERDSGNVLLVEIAGPGAPPVITPVPTGGLSWLALEHTLREAGEIGRIRAQIEALPAPGSTLLRIRLGGVLAAQDQDDLIRLGEILGARFLFGRLEADGLRPAPDDERWIAALPPGVLRGAAEHLRTLADPDFAGERPLGAGADVAAWALLELFALASEAPEHEP